MMLLFYKMIPMEIVQDIENNPMEDGEKEMLMKRLRQ